MVQVVPWYISYHGAYRTMLHIVISVQPRLKHRLQSESAWSLPQWRTPGATQGQQLAYSLFVYLSLGIYLASAVGGVLLKRCWFIHNTHPADIRRPSSRLRLRCPPMCLWPLARVPAAVCLRIFRRSTAFVFKNNS